MYERLSHTLVEEKGAGCEPEYMGYAYSASDTTRSYIQQLYSKFVDQAHDTFWTKFGDKTSVTIERQISQDCPERCYDSQEVGPTQY
jgi:hypothetical protein